MPNAPRERVFSRDAVRRIDQSALLDYGIPGIVLMENAAAALETAAVRLLESRQRADPWTAVILCGPGNNGGDGLALARRLHNRGVAVALAMSAAPPLREVHTDAAINLRIVERMGLSPTVVDPSDPAATLDALCARLGHPTLLVDALLGTGMRAPARPPITGMISWINRRSAAADGPAVLAVDIPTGLDCDTGLPLLDPALDAASCVVRADATVTFVGRKRGMLSPGAARWLGAVSVGDIGAPRELVDRLGTER